MNERIDMEQELWDYIDGRLREPRLSEVARLVSENDQWRRLHEELLETHLLLADAELEHPPMRFTRNVMEAIAREQITPAARQYLNNRIIYGLVAFFLLPLAFLAIYAIAGVPGSDPGTASNTVPEMDFSKLLSGNWINFFLMANIILALFLLDRVLNARRQTHLKQDHS